jgi:hypothetical protein
MSNTGLWLGMVDELTWLGCWLGWVVGLAVDLDVDLTWHCLLLLAAAPYSMMACMRRRPAENPDHVLLGFVVGIVLARETGRLSLSWSA